MSTRSLYVVATGQHVGKTTVSLGLMRVLADRGLKVHFFKPVGQQTVEREGVRIDKDAVLIQSALSIEGVLSRMSPVTVPRGFVENYIFNRDVEPLKRGILKSYEQIRHGCDVIVIEGTGHAGVGSCFDLSNAEVASLLGARALLVVEGGVGSTLDEVALNLGLFQIKDVQVIGVVANKVWPDKCDHIGRVLKQGLGNMGLRFLGAIPFDATLTYPRVGQIARELGAEVLCGERFLDKQVHNILVAAMEPQDVLPRILPRSLMITPGDRVDNILVAAHSGLLRSSREEGVVALLLTGGFSLHPAVLALVEASGLPVLLSKEDTYPVTARVQCMVFKMLPDEVEKIQQAQRLVKQHVNIDAILPYLLGEASA
jgi:BioD-like phosphotransacetylase family protein